MQHQCIEFVQRNIQLFLDQLFFNFVRFSAVGFNRPIYFVVKNGAD